jgi:hypothetical protein
VVKSYPPVLIVGWTSDNVDSLPRFVLFRLVAPSLQPREVGLFPGTWCMVLQSFAAGVNRLYSEVLGHNRWPTVPKVN